MVRYLLYLTSATSQWLALASRHHRYALPPGHLVTLSGGHLVTLTLPGSPMILPASRYHRNILSQPLNIQFDISWCLTKNPFLCQIKIQIRSCGPKSPSTHRCCWSERMLLNWISFCQFSIGPVECWRLSYLSRGESLATECNHDHPSVWSPSSEPDRVRIIIMVIMVIIMIIMIISIISVTVIVIIMVVPVPPCSSDSLQ